MDNIVQNSSTPKKIVIILCKIGRKQGGARFPWGKHHFNMTQHWLLAQSLLTTNAVFFYTWTMSWTWKFENIQGMNLCILDIFGNGGAPNCHSHHKKSPQSPLCIKGAGKHGWLGQNFTAREPSQAPFRYFKIVTRLPRLTRSSRGTAREAIWIPSKNHCGREGPGRKLR